MFGFKGKRSLVPTDDYKDEDAESLLSNSEQVQRSTPRSNRLNFIFWLVASNLVTAVFVAWITSSWKPNLDNLCAAYTSYYSPILKDVDFKYTTARYNGSFFQETIYRQDASPEVDKAWKDLGVDYRALRIPEEEAEKSGLTKSHVKISDKYGGGYPANVQGLHNLHCLNLIRQTLNWNYDYYKALGEGAFKNDKNIVKVHTTHCLDMIRQRLMCEVDTGVLGQVWWGEGENKPVHAFVDFNVQHRCKNYDAVRAWAETRQLPEADQTPADFLAAPQGLVYGAIP